MIEIAICDDEKRLRQELRNILERELELNGLSYHIYEFDSGEALLMTTGAQEREGKQFDILFLDIEMKELNGMETARRLRKMEQETVIVFVTAYPDYVFQGYEVKALNYILKPYDKKRLIGVLHAAMDELHAAGEQFYVVEQKSGSTRLSLSRTKYFYSERRLIHAVTTAGTVSFYGKLNELVLELPEYFIRIHNRYLVNLNYITSIDAGCVFCKTAEGDGEREESLPVSRAQKQELAVAFAKYMLR